MCGSFALLFVMFSSVLSLSKMVKLGRIWYLMYLFLICAYFLTLTCFCSDRLSHASKCIKDGISNTDVDFFIMMCLAHKCFDLRKNCKLC